MSGSAGLFGLFYIKIPLTAILDRFEKKPSNKKQDVPVIFLSGDIYLKSFGERLGMIPHAAKALIMLFALFI